MVIAWSDDEDLARRLSQLGGDPSRTQVIAHTRIPSCGDAGRVAVIPHDPEAFGRALYAVLHRCDEEGAELILVEALPARPEWEAIRDRLRRASAI